jgi:hypothetical protein
MRIIAAKGVQMDAVVMKSFQGQVHVSTLVPSCASALVNSPARALPSPVHVSFYFSERPRRPRFWIGICFRRSLAIERAIVLPIHCNVILRMDRPRPNRVRFDVKRPCLVHLILKRPVVAPVTVG